MLSLEQTKELLNEPELTDEEIKKIRNDFDLLAEIIFEKWRTEKSVIKENLGNDNLTLNKYGITNHYN